MSCRRTRRTSAERKGTTRVFNVLLFLKALLAGFIVAVPIGAIGAMCLRRALQGRWVIGLVTGFGAALADALLATAAMFGLSLLTRYILENQRPVLLVGGVFLILIGLRMIHKRHTHLETEETVTNGQNWHLYTGAFGTGFVLTIINPATLIAFVGVFAGLGLFKDALDTLLRDWIVIVGAFTGSMLWWVTLTLAALAVRRHLSVDVISIVNVILGVVVMGFGVASLLSVFGVS